MRIKELHIRNIASIERGDIDFDNELKDYTGEVAPLFLISGDTGAGKSVILDCIAMALFQKTPRIDGVTNVMHNEYLTTEGESMRVASIEQYTRLGISEHDDCYSWLVFEGNDGIVYQARLTLGMKRERGKKDEERKLKHKRAKWEVKVGEADWQQGTKDVAAIIQDAIGITFEQFGRIAMLAQGQFAAFLTGKKEERESILEQLTNTERFTQYGQAIKNLFGRAQDTYKSVQTEYDTEKSHILNDEERERLIAEQAQLVSEKQQTEKQLQALEVQIAQVTALAKAQHDAADAQRELAQIDTTMKEEPFLKAEALIKGWDATTKQRQLWAQKDEALQRKQKAITDVQQCQGTFRQLSADLLFKKKETEALALRIAQLRQWLAERQEKDQLYAQSAAVVQQIHLYETTLQSLKADLRLLHDENEKTAVLQQAATKATEQATQAVATVNSKQAEIDAQRQLLESLALAQINSQLHQKYEQRAAIGQLRLTLRDITEKQEAQRHLEQDLTAQKQQFIRLDETYRQTQSSLEQAKKNNDEANNRLLTMQTSLEEHLVTLRHRMVEEHTQTCPLCGQHIDYIELDEEFRSFLTPLEQEQAATQKALEQASQLHQAAEQEFHQASGKLQTTQKHLSQQQRTLDSVQEQATKKASLLGWNTELPTEQQVSESLEKLQQEIGQLERKQKEAEQVQARLNVLIEEKKPLDEAMKQANTSKIQAEQALFNNTQEIRRLTLQQTEREQMRDRQRSEIHVLLSSTYPAWQDDTVKTVNQLLSEAEEYTTRKKALNEQENQLHILQQNVETITTTQRNILVFHPEWDTEVNPAESPNGNVHQQWTRLLASVSAATKTIEECTQTIKECEDELQQYYLQTHTDEEALTALIGQEQQLTTSRNFVNQIRERQASRRDALSAARQQMSEAIAALGQTAEDCIPSLEQLQQEKTALSEVRDQTMSTLSAIQTRLDDDQRNQQKFQQIATRLEAAQQQKARWERLNTRFGGTRFRTLVQSYILRPLLNNANNYLQRITDRYRLTCSQENEQLSILVHDRYHKDQVRSATVLSGGERFMISLALSLALSSFNRPDMKVNILFIDEGFGTLDEHSLDSVMSTLERLQEMAGQSNRRVGIISHREELEERIPVQIRVEKRGEGRSCVTIKKL